MERGKRLSLGGGRTLPEKDFERVINALDSEVKTLRQRKSLRLLILFGSSDRKKNVLQRFVQTIKQSDLNVAYATLEDLSRRDRVEFDENVIIIDGLDYFLFQPPLGRLSLKLKLSRFFDEVRHRPATLIILGVTSDSALKYFFNKFKMISLKAEILEIK